MILTIIMYMILWMAVGSISAIAACAFISPKAFVKAVESIKNNGDADDAEWFIWATLAGTVFGFVTAAVSVVVVIAVLFSRIIVEKVKTKDDV